MRDPDARPDRRAWTGCTACPDGSDCPDCQERRTCERHWRFLLDTQGPQVFLQCPRCLHRWWHDTRFGVGGRPLGIEDLPEPGNAPEGGRAA
jgi:hypothetical protein